MLLVTTSALVLLAIKFLSGHKVVLGMIAVALLLLAGFMVEETVRNLRRLRTGQV